MKAGSLLVLKGDLTVTIYYSSAHYTMQESFFHFPQGLCFYLGNSNDKDHCLTRQPISHVNIPPKNSPPYGKNLPPCLHMQSLLCFLDYKLAALSL